MQRHVEVQIPHHYISPFNFNAWVKESLLEENEQNNAQTLLHLPL